MKNLDISCPCLFGLESTLTFEAKKQGFKNITTENGRVSFKGDLSDVAKANIFLRTAERVQIVLKKFTATSFDELFDETRSIGFEKFITKNEAFPVTGYTIDSALFSMSDCQSIIKKAIVTRLQDNYNISWFEESGATIPIHFGIRKNVVSIMLDTTGVGLHKRSYRKTSVMAPIKETLAAGIVDLARVNKNSMVFDPMCGSGTMIIEAAMKACNTAPGINREFIFEKWNIIDRSIISLQRQKAADIVDDSVKFTAFAADVDKRAVALTKENIQNAGLKCDIEVIQADIKDFYFPGHGATLITNPPYGERLLEQNQAEELYKTMGQVFTDNLKQYIITSHQNFEEIFGRTADRRRKLYNGMIPCQLYMYYKNTN